VPSSSQIGQSSLETGPSGLPRISVEGGFEDYHARNSIVTSLVSSRTHVKPEEEDPADEGAKDEGRSSQEGERRVLQHYPASDPDEARLEGQGEGRCPYTHGLR
jgi:hypothetical protein